MIHIRRIAHVSLLVSDTDRSLRFYRDLLDLPIDSERPELGFAGAWLNIGDQAIHLLELPNPDPVDGRPAHGGRDRHVAFLVGDLEDLKSRLNLVGIPFTESSSGRRALFCRDPDGNALEFIEVTRD